MHNQPNFRLLKTLQSLNMDAFIEQVYAQHPEPSPKISEQFGFGGINSLGIFINRLIPLAFSIAAMMVVFYFIIGAFELITSQGDKAHIVSARSKIYHSIIGFVLLMALFLIMQYLLPALGITGLNIL